MKILKYKQVNSGSLTGVLNLDDPASPYIVNDIKVFQKGDGRWIQMPSKEYEVNGERRFFPYNHFRSREEKDQYTRRVLDALDEYCKANPPQEEPKQQMSFDEVPF